MAKITHMTKAGEAREPLWDNQDVEEDFDVFRTPPNTVSGHVVFSPSRAQVDFDQLPSYTEASCPAPNRHTNGRSCDRRTKWILIATGVVGVCVLLLISLSIVLVNTKAPIDDADNHGTCGHTPCRNGATCLDGTDGIFHCICPRGFTGNLCEIDEDECASNPCSNSETCHDGRYGYSCQCLSGFSGERCEIDVDECQSSPCLSGATCHDHPSLYQCQCPSGFTGTHCQININDCEEKPCYNGGECIDGINEYHCACAANFTGSRCSIAISIHGNCPESFLISRELSRCYLVSNSRATREEAERACRHFDSELVSLETDRETEFVGPHLDWLSYDYLTSGRRDETSHELKWQTGEVISINHPSWYPGSPSSQFNCVSVIKPDTSPTFAIRDVECQNSGPFVCERATSIYTMDCASDPCHNGAICQDVTSYGITCECTAGYTGRLCETEIDACASYPCDRGARCQDTLHGYECHEYCTVGFVPGMNYTRCYMVQEDPDKKLSWADAHEFCEFKQASLVSLETQAETQSISSLFYKKRSLHVTSARRERDSRFYWSTGDVLPLNHGAWAPDEPRAHYDCVGVAQKRDVTQLYVIDCGVPRAYVCEKGPLI